MGNMFSTRWNGVWTRLDTGRSPALDMAHLRRIGALTPDAVVTLTWTDAGGVHLGTIRTHMHPAGQTLTLAGGGTVERFSLVSDPCNYGGSRLYVTCLGCDHRRRVLYGVGMVFRCRKCHDLAYQSTREERSDRAHRRLAKLYGRLGTVPDHETGIPPKPPGMYRTTYAGILHQIRQEYARQSAELRTYVADHGLVKHR
ncbi:MAG: hypothetical protein ACR2OU_17210 [Thermomicrobiales bacterium]